MVKCSDFFTKIMPSLFGDWAGRPSPIALSLINEDDGQIELQAYFRRIVARKSRQDIRWHRRTLAFTAIAAVTVRHWQTAGKFEDVDWCEVGLKLQQGKSIALGRTIDCVEGSIIAAHLSTMMNIPVERLERLD